MSELSALIDQLHSKDNRLAYASLKQLLAESETGDAVYAYWDTFAAMMDNSNSYVRTRGLLLLTANVRWDREQRLDILLPAYLSHIQDAKPVTARQLIQALPTVGQVRPDLIPALRDALANADLSGYPDSMAPLVAKDICGALQQLDRLEAVSAAKGTE